jgi:hypothetical protein
MDKTMFHRAGLLFKTKWKFILGVVAVCAVLAIATVLVLRALGDAAALAKSKTVMVASEISAGHIFIFFCLVAVIALVYVLRRLSSVELRGTTIAYRTGLLACVLSVFSIEIGLDGPAGAASDHVRRDLLLGLTCMIGAYLAIGYSYHFVSDCYRFDSRPSKPDPSIAGGDHPKPQNPPPSQAKKESTDDGSMVTFVASLFVGGGKLVYDIFVPLLATLIVAVAYFDDMSKSTEFVAERVVDRLYRDVILRVDEKFPTAIPAAQNALDSGVEEAVKLLKRGSAPADPSSLEEQSGMTPD